MTITRKPFETVDVPDVERLDYVRFHAVIETDEVWAQNARADHGRRKVNLCTPTGGAGQVLRLNMRKVAAVPPRNMQMLSEGVVETFNFTTARVDAGPGLGVVTAILNGGELIGKQCSLADELLIGAPA